MQVLRRIGRLVSGMAGGGTSNDGADGLSVRENAAVVIGNDGRIAWVGDEADLASPGVFEEVDLGGALVTAGLIDAHSHPVYGGDRFGEIAMRSAGASYEEIAAAGGGIASSVQATRATDLRALEQEVRDRLRSWLRGGTTTVEAKTGYFLDETGELAAVRLLARCASSPLAEDLPSVEITYLGGHAVGPEWGGDGDAYAEEAAKWSGAALAEGARHADVFCDVGYFTVDQSRRMLNGAVSAGLLPRIHADELALTGGAQLAAELGCVSADHLLCLDETGIAALAGAGVVATLAPVTALAMGRTPPARALVEAGATVALGTDHNPGMCGTTSMSLVVALAVAELGLSVGEAVVAATAGGARSLRLEDRGLVATGMRADLVAWDADHEGAFAWAYGLRPLSVWRAGRRVSP